MTARSSARFHLCVLLLGVTACGNTTSAPSASAQPHPPDQATPDELAEGPDAALGLRIPRRLRVVTREQYNIVAEGPLGRDVLASYVRAHATATESKAEKSLIFSDVKLTSPTEPFNGDLTIEVSGSDTFSRLRISGQPPIVPARPRRPHS